MSGTVDGDDLFYDRALRRIYRWLILFSAGGAVAVLALRDWRAMLGFLTGAGISGLSFRWIHQLADSLGQTARPPRRATAVFLGLRYLIFGAIGYVIVRVFGVTATSILLGLLVSVAAILAEIIYELIYART